MESTTRVIAFWKWGMMMSGRRGNFIIESMESQISRGAALARSGLNAATSSNELDINVQFSGVETMDSRQYRHTRVNRNIALASRACQGRTYRATRDRISGGNLLTGCDKFRKDEINLDTSCTLASRLSIYEVHLNQTAVEMDMPRCPTSGFSETAESTGESGVSRNLVQPRPSFSLNTRRRSGMERSRAASKDMMVDGVKPKVAWDE